MSRVAKLKFSLPKRGMLFQVQDDEDPIWAHSIDRSDDISKAVNVRGEYVIYLDSDPKKSNYGGDYAVYLTSKGPKLLSRFYLKYVKTKEISPSEIFS